MIEGFIADITETRLAQEALKKSEEKFRAVIENSGAAIAVRDPDGRIIVANQEFLHRFSGADTRTMDLVFPDQDKDLSGWENDQEEIMIETTGRDQHTYVVSRFSLRTETGDSFGTAIIAHDITARKQAEQSLVEKTRLLDTIIETIPHGIFWKNAEGQYEGGNTEAARNWGLCHRDEMLGKTIEDLAGTPAEAGKINRIDDLVLRSGEPSINQEDQHVRTDGTVATHLTSRLPLVDARGNVTGLLGIYLDISQRKAMENALRESESLFRGIATATQDAIVLADGQARISFWNDAATAIFGYTSEEVVGRPVHEIMAPEATRARAEQSFSAFRRSGRGELLGKTMEFEACHKNGKPIPVELSLASLKRKGEWQSVAVIRDVTERNAAEQQLRHDQKMRSLGHLAGGMAHELNNILQPILGMTQMVMETLPAEDVNANRLEMVIHSAKRAAKIVAQVLDFSLRSGGEMKPVELAGAIRRIAPFLAASTPPSIIIEEQIDENAGWVSGDATQIETVVINLISNARDSYEDKGGVITIEVAAHVAGTGRNGKLNGLEPGRYARLSIIDRGRGMGEETLEHILDPFFTTKEVGKGTGLGMSIVDGIVSRHHGSIRIDSAIGDGTRVDIYFPCLEAAAPVTSDRNQIVLPIAPPTA